MSFADGLRALIATMKEAFKEDPMVTEMRTSRQVQEVQRLTLLTRFDELVGQYEQRMGDDLTMITPLYVVISKPDSYDLAKRLFVIAYEDFPDYQERRRRIVAMHTKLARIAPTFEQVKWLETLIPMMQEFLDGTKWGPRQ
jgi:hypothetical protein